MWITFVRVEHDIFLCTQWKSLEDKLINFFYKFLALIKDAFFKTCLVSNVATVLERHKHYFIFKRSKITPLCISRETAKVAVFLSAVEIRQVLGIEVPTGGSTESNAKSFEVFVTIYLSITIFNYTKYLLIKLSFVNLY
jgi:hypothetical protein